MVCWLVSPMPQLLIATNNPGKAAEFRRLLAGCGWELVAPAQLDLKLPEGDLARPTRRMLR